MSEDVKLEDVKLEDVKLMVTIPLEEYNKLTSVLLQFNEIIELHRKAIEGAYQQRIAHLERLCYSRDKI